MTLPGPTVLATAMLLTGCAADPAVREGLARVGHIGPEQIEGRVRLVGNHPFARPIVVPLEGDAMQVSGPYRGEIGRLAGIDVRVTGVLDHDTYPETSLQASSYELVSVEGDTAFVGVLEGGADGWVLRTQAGDVRVSVVSEALADRTGSLVWIVLDENEGAARYGVLRGESQP